MGCVAGGAPGMRQVLELVFCAFGLSLEPTWLLTSSFLHLGPHWDGRLGIFYGLVRRLQRDGCWLKNWLDSSLGWGLPVAVSKQLDLHSCGGFCDWPFYVSPDPERLKRLHQDR